jgi:NADPH-dependent 2,4-dienoyl-CoA reductase/sulfur reductase-like enzyme
MMREADVVVVGCGAAGMSAAATAASLGLRTLLLDEQAAPGGQIYRGITTVPAALAERLGPDYRYGRTLSDTLAGSAAQVLAGALVWDVDADLNVAYVREGIAHQVRARHLIVATGAIERAAPIPGWTLPGVFYAGAAQLLLKTAASIPSGPVVLAGNGPLLLLVANQLLEAGAKVAALVETARFSDLLGAAQHLPRALGAAEYLAKGLAMMRTLRSSRTRWVRGASALRALGETSAQALQARVGSETITVEAETVLLHFGVIPNTQLTRLMRLEHRWNEVQQAWQPDCNAWGRSSHPRVTVAGDGAGIGGAQVAEAGGVLAALDAACALDRIKSDERDRRATAPRTAIRRHLRIRPLLDALYAPPAWITNPPDETIVCRCEEVTAGEIRAMTKLGCRGPNQTKFFSRCGMGPCQGRVCGPTVAAILAKESGLSPQEVGYYRIRPPLKPLPLAALAALADTDATADPIDTA